MRKISAMIEWRSRPDGLSGLILLLCLMVLWFVLTGTTEVEGRPDRSLQDYERHGQSG